MTRVIQVLPLGPVATQDLRAISDTVARIFGCPGQVLPAVSLPAHSYRPARGQHDADVLLDFLFDRLGFDVMRLIGVTESDLFADGRNFVFGYAHMRDRVAVFSTLRLRESFWGRADRADLFRSRIDKALAHELGHTFHTPHCEHKRCVMHQVEFLWQLDELDPIYCHACAQRVLGASARGVHGGDALFELAGSYMRRRRFHRAAAAYSAAAEQDPRNAHYCNDHGVALLALGERAAAARAFQRAIQLEPAFPHAYYNLGIVSRERGDVPTAEYFFDEALRRDSDPRAAHRYLGVLHQDYFHDSARARLHLERFIALGGVDDEVRRRLDLLARGEDTARRMAELVPSRSASESSAPV